MTRPEPLRAPRDAARARIRGPAAPTARRAPIRATVAAPVAAALAGLAPGAHAAGFALIEHGASGLGYAYAGASAIAEDASTIWFNPAGMSEIEGRELAVAGHVIRTDPQFENRGTTLAASLGATEISGSDDANGGTTSPVPNFYYSAPINGAWSYGLAVGVPFGSSTEWDRDWVGRYTTVESGISVIDINPALSYRVSDAVRLGAGLSVQFLSAEFGSAVDSGAVCLAVYDAAGAPEQCFEAGLTPGNVERDGYAEITGDSIGVGFNLGALFLPAENTRIGLAFRSGVSHDADAEGDFDTDPALRGLLDAAGQTTLVADQDASAELDLPPTLSLSGAQRLGRVQLLGDITWTGWSSFEELRVEYDEGQPDTLSIQDYDDVIRVSAGLTFEASPAWQLRAGLAWDEEAIPGPERRTARIPGNDRTWVALGAGWRANDRLSLDVGYAHLFTETTAIDNRNLEAPGGSVVRGEIDSSADILSAQLNWAFD